MGKKKTFAEIRKATSRHEKSVEICVDGQLQARLDEVDAEMRSHRKWEPTALSDEDPRTVLEAQRADIITAMREHTYTFRFRSLSPKEYSDLLAQHPPREQDRKEKLNFNVDTFAAALIAACAVDPEMTPEEAEDWFSELNTGARDKLFNTAWLCNQMDVSVPFSGPVSRSPASSGQK